MSHGGAGVLRRTAQFLATSTIVVLALLAGLVIWQSYVVSPWTRDGRTRVQVANVAPQVSGQITELDVVDNQFVRKGDLLYVIDPFDFRTALANAEATQQMRAADLVTKRVEAQRRLSLNSDSTSVEEKQTYSSSAVQAEAAFRSAQTQVAQARVNLNRTEVRSPVNGYVTNLQMRVGDYAREGTTNLSITDADSFWIDGYFEETKMAYVCVGEPAHAKLMGFAKPIDGVVETITRGISTSDAASSTQGLPDVNPVYTWVRLAQRIPVRIRITQVPPDVPLVAGMTATVSVDSPIASHGVFDLTGLRRTLNGLIGWPTNLLPRHCDISSPVRADHTTALPDSEAGTIPNARQLHPTLAPGMDIPPSPRSINR